ncbi:MAG: polymorphic toxin-type HINT domain-containing protein [Ktedonobacteraceae bacterium]
MLAYNPKTRKMEDEPILHVWIHTDNDLVDLTLTTKLHAPHSTVTTTANEVIHTNKKHPFFTEEQGFVPVGQLKLGMHVLRADGRYGVITGYKVVPGAKVMYNLEVAQDHTFTVGIGQWVVHNATCPVKDLNPVHSPATSGSRPELEKLSDQELLNSVNNSTNNDPIQINTQTGKIMDGNGRAYELLRRAALPGGIITPDTPIYYEPYTPSSIPEPWEQWFP